MILLQGLATGEAIDVPVFRLVLGILLSIVLAFAAAVFLRQRMNTGKGVGLSSVVASFVGKDSPASRLSVVESYRISPTATASLLLLDDTEYLVVTTQESTLLLREQQKHSFADELRGRNDAAS